MLTCFSALLLLLFHYESTGTVTPENAKQIVELTPTQRMELLANQAGRAEISDCVSKLLAQYERFLTVTRCKKEELTAQFSDESESAKFKAQRSEFGDTVFNLLQMVGGMSRERATPSGNFYRMLIV